MGKSSVAVAAAAAAGVLVGFKANAVFSTSLHRPTRQGLHLSLSGGDSASDSAGHSLLGLWVPLTAVSLGLAAAAHRRASGVTTTGAAAVAEAVATEEEGLVAFLVNGHRAKRDTRQTTEAVKMVPPQVADEVSPPDAQQSPMQTTQAAVAKAAPPVPNVSKPPAPAPAFDPAKQLGVTAPLGYFDPASFCKTGDEESFRQLRVAELKHGRVAMMAAAGALVQSAVQLPGFDGVPKGLGAILSMPGGMGFAALVLAAGCLELLFWKETPEKGIEAIGDFGNPLAVPVSDLSDMRNRELNNGRAAMFAIVGIVAAELATGKTAIEQLI